MLDKLLKSQTFSGTVIAVLFVILLVSGFFLFKSATAHADELADPAPVTELTAEAVVTEEAEPVVKSRQCDVVIPAGSSWDFDAIKAKAAKYGCEVKQFFFDGESEADLEPATAS